MFRLFGFALKLIIVVFAVVGGLSLYNGKKPETAVTKANPAINRKLWGDGPTVWEHCHVSREEFEQRLQKHAGPADMAACMAYAEDPVVTKKAPEQVLRTARDIMIEHMKAGHR